MDARAEKIIADFEKKAAEKPGEESLAMRLARESAQRAQRQAEILGYYKKGAAVHKVSK